MTHTQRHTPTFITLAALCLALLAIPSASQTAVTLSTPLSGTYNAAHYTQTPITTVESAPPVVMLNMTRDHQLFYKAYNDYSDLDNDGAPETTYKHSINYYGYFDSGKCYTYTSDRYEPASITTTKYCNAGTTTGQWSGNFLNWVSTTRFDAVRKLLYGGTRSTDSSTDTVLERVALPTDAHSFAKYYNGTDIAQLTPFTSIPTTVPSATSNTSRAVGTGSRQFNTTGSLDTPSLGDQINVVRTTDATQVMRGYVTATAANSVTIQVYSSQGSGTFTNWTLTNLSRTGLSFCSTTWAASGQTAHGLSTSTYPPLLRVARGNFELWGANERWQCYWREEKGDVADIAASGRNANQSFFSSLNASSANPRKDTHALGTGSNAGLSNTANGEYIVRVRACVAGLVGNERCKVYPSGNSKPIGLLQVYGDDDRIRFGLMTSSYQRNVSGGVLRKNVGSFRDEANEDTDGRFTAAPVADVDGSAGTAVGGIVDTINRIRMWGYRYDDGTYINGDRENCDFQLVGIAATGTTVGNREVAEGNCASWGNPVGEVYLESLRYLAGLTNTTAFDYGTATTNKDPSLGLNLRSFTNPINNTNYCSSLNVLTFTASVSSYDNDQMGGLANLRGSPNVLTFTDSIGTAESIHGGNWFVGNAPSNLNQLCTGKTINNLSAVDGICPEASAIEGSFQIGGAALYARTNRIRNDFPAAGATPAVPPSNDTTSFKVTSYGIELATNTPTITVLQPGTGRKVSIQPVYRLDRSSTGAGPFGSGAIVDFRIVSQDTVNGRGRFYVNWEDSTQGGDYDQDMYGIIEYEFLTNNQIKISTNAVAAATANGQGFGYIISGTTQDGPHFHSGILEYDYLNEAASNPISVRDPLGRVLNNTAYAEYGNRVFIGTNGGCTNCRVDDPQTSVTYTLGAAAAGTLKSPLYYMSKFGGFTDSNNNNLPDLTTEWDSRDRNGLPGSDGVPDTYFLVSNPTALESSLRSALDAIIARTASGTAAAVVSNAQEGQGAVYQALYESSRTDANGRNVKWIGSLQAVFIDAKGNLREDGDADATLDESDFTADPAFEAFFDTTDRTTKLRRFTGDPDVSSTFTVVPLANVRTVWNAREQLSALTSVETQRNYTDIATSGRHIFTYIDSDADGLVDTGETFDFLPATFSSRYALLNVGNSTQADAVTRYLRGVEVTGFRSRTLDYNGDGTTEIMRLGDVVQSTPTPVGRPSEGYNLLYGDQSYNEFARRWAQRRTVVYVGANDGMLHAFNSGFYNATTKRFDTSRSGATAHPLGAELWAYVPFNLLPHLRWLTENNYAHQYYVDGKPKVFDARIFSPESACSTDPSNSACIHPNGWGTVMVVGMRLGGGQLDLPTANTGLSGTQASFRSSYAIFDITNPEVRPTLLAEISSANVGYTTGLPTVWVRSNRDNCPYTPSRSPTLRSDGTVSCNGARVAASTAATDILAKAAAEQWYLVFGSGPRNDSPDGARTGALNVTGPSGKLFVYDLKTKALARTALTVEASSFLGDATSVDWDINFRTDNLYFGSIGGNSQTPTGKLYKMTGVAETDSAIEVLNPGGPVINAPAVTLDELGNRWLYAGTGRYYVNGGTAESNDKLSSAQQSYFGVIDRLPTASSTTTDASYDTALPRGFSSLVNTSSAAVLRNGTVSGVADLTSTELPDSALPGLTAAERTEARRNNTETKLVRSARLKKGWRINLAAATPSERLVSRTALFGDILFATPFTPSPTLCQGEGSSRLTGVYFKTGAPRAAVPTFGSTTNGTTTLDDDQVISSVALGQGLAAGVALHMDSNSSISTSQLTAISQTSTAALTSTDITVGASARSGEIDWRDSRRNR